MAHARPDVVFDCNIFLQAISREAGPAANALRLVETGDHDDEPYLDLAAAVGADYLVSRDNDLLSLMSDYSIEAKQFRQRFPSLRIVNPVAFLAQVLEP